MIISVSGVVLHNLSFFAKNEECIGEKFFAKNGSRKIYKKLREKTAKKDPKSAEIDPKMVHICQNKYLE